MEDELDKIIDKTNFIESAQDEEFSPEFAKLLIDKKLRVSREVIIENTPQWIKDVEKQYGSTYSPRLVVIWSLDK